MKKLKLLLIVLLLSTFIGGCESLKVDGFSVGVMKIDADVNGMEIEGYAPIGLLNFKFVE